MKSLVAILILLSCAIACGASSNSVNVGKEGFLLRATAVAVNEQAYDELTDAAVAKDEMGFALMRLNGKLFLIEKKTKVLVINRTFFRSKVRILEGEYLGRSGWVATEFVKRY